MSLHVQAQVRVLCKGLRAVDALEGSFSRVAALVPLKIALLRKGHWAFGALVGPLPVVGPQMRRQGSPIRKGLRAVLTKVGSFPRVNPHVSLKVVRRKKGLWTVTALMWSQVGRNVLLKPGIFRKILWAKGTAEWSFLVSHDVRVQR